MGLDVSLLDESARSNEMFEYLDFFVQRRALAKLGYSFPIDELDQHKARILIQIDAELNRLASPKKKGGSNGKN